MKNPSYYVRARVFLSDMKQVSDIEVSANVSAISVTNACFIFEKEFEELYDSIQAVEAYLIEEEEQE